MENLSGKIFLADLKGSRLFHDDEPRLGDLYVFNDEMLAEGGSHQVETDGTTISLILPVTGDLLYQPEGMSVPMEIGVGQVLICRDAKVKRFSIHNPFDDAAINYLRIGLHTVAEDHENIVELLDFDIFGNRNRLININPVHTPELHFRLAIGQFDGRQEALYQLSAPGRLFCFVLAGAFEIEGRLLHAKDGLALWDIDTAEMEALSNHAVVLTLEIKERNLPDDPF